MTQNISIDWLDRINKWKKVNGIKRRLCSNVFLELKKNKGKQENKWPNFNLLGIDQMKDIGLNPLGVVNIKR